MIVLQNPVMEHSSTLIDIYIGTEKRIQLDNKAKNIIDGERFSAADLFFHVR
jgi:hypothetical protein